jgi:DNA polymerase-3 subunit beta
MKLSLLQDNFQIALTHVSRFVASKSQLPILNNIVLATDSGRLKLSATNLDLSINYWLGAKIDKEGSISVPAKELTEFVSYLTPGKIDLEVVDGLLKISSPKANSTFATTPVADFPQIPTLDPKTAFELDYQSFSPAVGKVVFTAAVDDSRPVLTAILCHFSANNLLMVGTDGFRLSLEDIKLVNPIDLKTDDSNIFLIPSRTLSEVTKLAKNAKTIKVGLTSDSHQVVFVLEDLEIVSRLLQGDYPDYQRIIPGEFTTRAFVNREELTQAVKIASVFARESANVVKFNFKPSSLELTANAPQIGQNLAVVDAKIEGEPLEIAFNYKYVSDFLAVCQGDEIVIGLNQPLTPGLFQDQGSPHFTHIIMPVRIQD